MISRVPPCLDTSLTYSVPEVVNVEAASVIRASSSSSSEITQQANSLLYSLSFLKDKVRQVQSLVGILVAPDQAQPESTSIAVASITTMVQEVIMTASSMMFTCQQMVNNLNNNHSDSTNAARADWKVVQDGLGHERGVQSLFTEQTFDWYADDNNNDYNCENLRPQVTVDKRVDRKKKLSKGVESFSEGYDIIELEAEDLLAKYTHYCQVCGKGFKRDANLRMHMRAHGDEYKTNAALSNPMKRVADEKDSLPLPRKYSCPHEGCRWNKKHEKFQPLKSMVCVKNHYKRSHCPKMYVCKRCNRKQFSVLSDLRTHEKHCGDLKWQCSCGTTFSRKDKLMGHVALFVGHSPVATESPKPAKAEKNQSVKMHIDDRG